MTKRRFLTLDLIEDNALYLNTHLSQVLKSEKLKFSKPTMLVLEAKGIITAPDEEIVNPDIDKEKWRAYKGSTIKLIVERVREYQTR